MSVYLFINLCILAIPLCLSFERRIAFCKKWPAVFLSIAIVGIFYILWDIFATWAGHWWFNSRYVSSAEFFFLPFEEILFFVTAPYSCLFIYEVLEFFHPDRSIKVNHYCVWVLCAVLLLLGSFWVSRAYTVLSLLSLVFFLLIATRYFYDIFARQNFWIYMAICYVPFLIFNGILTGLPVVQYSPQAILGWRVITIPVEDFVYNFSLLGFVVIVYRRFQPKKNHV